MKRKSLLFIVFSIFSFIVIGLSIYHFNKVYSYHVDVSVAEIIEPPKPRLGIERVAVETIAITPPTPQPTFMVKPKITLISEGKVATGSVRGNLGPPSVVTSEIVEDWLKDRWQAATGMSGDPIPGAHWIEIDLERDYWIRKILIDWETAYSDFWTIEAKVQLNDDWQVLCRGKDAKVTVVNRQHRLHEVFFQGSHEVEDPHMILKPHSPSLAPLSKAFRYVRLAIQRPSTQWGSSVWRLQVWGYKL